MKINYLTGEKVKEPIIIAENIKASYGEIVHIKLPNGEVRKGQIIGINKKFAVIEVYKGVGGINPKKVEITTTGKTATMHLSPLIIGRVFNGAYEPIDGGEEIKSTIIRDINGLVINPYMRDVPHEFIETGFSAIDGLNSIIRGQKIAIFSSKGVNNYRVVLDLVKSSQVPGENERFAIIFCGLGVPHEISDFFIKEFKKLNTKICAFINTAGEPIIERITAPRYALTAAEYLAFDLKMHVLVILVDMTEYCNALRELSSSKEEIQMRMGYPSYMYSDLASIYERCGVIKNKQGSITLIPVLTLPNDDITHPIPDLTGYITEGQIILSKELYKKGITPPVDILPSLSRLMHKGVGRGKTREDHPAVANQIYASYAKAKQIKETATIIGSESLSENDLLYLKFLKEFETNFLTQKKRRTINETLDLCWKLLSILNRNDLTIVGEELIKKYLPHEES